MNIQDQISAMQEALEPWCQQYRGTVHVAHNLEHLFKILGETPGAVRCGILYVGDVVRDDLNADVIGRVENKFWLAFSRGFNLERYPGKSLVEGVAGGKPMFEVITAAVNIIRTLEIGTLDEPMPWYRGTDLLNYQGVTVDALRSEIHVSMDWGDLPDDLDT